MENNYLSSTDKSLQTELNHKQNLTPQEQKKRDELNRKDAETSKALVDSCLCGSDVACDAARKDAQEKQNTYQNLSYQNQKEAQEGYRQIQQLLNDTGPEAKQTQELYNGMVASYVRTGMSEADAKTAVGYQLGAMYIAGGIAGIGSGKAVDEALTPDVKQSTPSTKPGTGTGSQTASKPSNGAENAANTPKTNSALKLGERAIINEVNITRVGRWMSPDELAQMQNGGKVVQGGGGQTFISTNGVSDFKATAPAGSVYVEFDVPTNSLLQGGKDGWFKLIGPDASKSQQFMLNKQGGSQLPEVKNITIVDKK